MERLSGHPRSNLIETGSGVSGRNRVALTSAERLLSASEDYESMFQNFEGTWNSDYPPPVDGISQHEIRTTRASPTEIHMPISPVFPSLVLSGIIQEEKCRPS